MEKRKPAFKIRWQFYITLALIILAGVYMRNFLFDEIVPNVKSLKQFPQMVGSWKNAGNHRLSDDVLDVLKVDDYVLRDFKNDEGIKTSLYIGYYATHRRSAEIHTPENCQVGGGWEILNKKVQKLNIPGIREKISFVEAVYEKDQEKMVFIYWYYVNGNYITNFFYYKLSVIMNSLLYHRSDASFVRITVPVIDDDIDSAVKEGERFLLDAVPVINRYLM